MGSISHTNSTFACDQSNCQVSCQSPAFPADVCYTTQQNFLDGTACGGGGRCQNGQCSGSSVGGEVTAWVEQNKPLVIGLSVGIAGLVLLAILGCLVRSWCRKPKPKRPPFWTQTNMQSLQSPQSPLQAPFPRSTPAALASLSQTSPSAPGSPASRQLRTRSDPVAAREPSPSSSTARLNRVTRYG
jgi:hypothetical protein